MLFLKSFLAAYLCGTKCRPVASTIFYGFILCDWTILFFYLQWKKAAYTKLYDALYMKGLFLFFIGTLSTVSASFSLPEPEDLLCRAVLCAHVPSRPGVKVEYRQNLPHDDWSLVLGYTYYHEEFTSLKKHFSSQTVPEGLGIIPLWHYPFLQIIGGPQGNPLRFHAAKANWHMNFHSMDLLLARPLFPEYFIPMTLSLGIKGAWIDQLYHADYEDGTRLWAIDPSSVLPAEFVFMNSHFQARTHQLGMGPRLSLDSKWRIGRGVHLIGNGGFSLLYSTFHVVTKYRDQIDPLPEAAAMKLGEFFHELTPVCEAMLGLHWETQLSRFFLECTMGYEWQYWWSINHIRRSFVQTAPGTTMDTAGDLQMQGLNASIRWVF